MKAPSPGPRWVERWSFSYCIRCLAISKDKPYRAGNDSCIPGKTGRKYQLDERMSAMAYGCFMNQPAFCLCIGKEKEADSSGVVPAESASVNIFFMCIARY